MNSDVQLINIYGSYGEQVIQNILEYNNIKYKREYNIINNVGRKQRMDFFVSYNSEKYCIEYHGEHHYKSVDFWESDVDEVRQRDKNKKDYCITHGIHYVEIPYTCNTDKKIYNKLKLILKNIKYPEHIIINKGLEINITEMLEYYNNHSRKETADYYGIQEYTLGNLLERLDRRSKRVPTDLIRVSKNGKEVLTGTYHDIKYKLPDIEVRNLHKCLNGEMDTTSDYSFEYIDVEKERVRINNINKRKESYKNKNQLRRGSSKKKVKLLNIFTKETFEYNSVKECYINSGLSKHKIYKLFNPNKDTFLVDKYIGIYEDGALSMSIEDAKKLFYRRNKN